MDTAVNFPTLILTILGIVSLVVGAATAYLRLYVGNKTGELHQAIQQDIEEGFARKDLIEAKFSEVMRRIEALETT